MRDPRSHRRYRELARKFIAAHRNDPASVACWLCKKPVAMHARPTAPLGPTIEHTLPVRYILANAGSYREALDLACDTSLWRIAHRRCQSAQGARAVNEKRRTRPALVPW